MIPVWIYGLAFKCPFEDEYAGCPFVPIRRLNNLRLQYEAIEKLTEQEKKEMLSFHWECKLKHKGRVNSFKKPG